MSEPSAELVNANRMARDGSSRQGELAISRMSRLRPLLSDDRGAARFELEFGLDSQSRPLVTGRIRATLELICQRCLEPMDVELELQVRLGIVRSDDEAVALGDGREPLLLEGDSLSLATLVEDELILGLPAAPLHPRDRCRPPYARPAEDSPEAGGPFSKLRGAGGAKRKKRR